MTALCITVLLVMTATGASAVTATLEDLPLLPGSYWNGSDGTGQFISAGATFVNHYNSSWGNWDGFAYSCGTDTTTLSYTNYSAIPGSGVDGSANYALAYDPVSGYMSLNYPTILFNSPTTVSGAFFTNTTYAALAMQNGYFTAKKFGGQTGNDADWFKLTITGKNVDGGAIGFVEFFLADFRFSNTNQDYIVDQWTWVDLSSLGAVSSLTFALSSSDNDPLYGMNTPGYFALDNLVYTPEPATFALLTVSGLFLARRKRK